MEANHSVERYCCRTFLRNQYSEKRSFVACYHSCVDPTKGCCSLANDFTTLHHNFSFLTNIKRQASLGSCFTQFDVESGIYFFHMTTSDQL